MSATAIWVATAFSLVPRKRLIFRVCLIQRKNSSICQRRRAHHLFGGARLADVEGQCAIGNAHALLADAQETADTDDDGADLALAVEDEIVDVPDGLTGHVVNRLADKYPGEPLVGRLLGDERYRCRGVAAAWANAWSASGVAAKARAPAKLMI